jgi:hypothetical protein
MRESSVRPVRPLLLAPLCLALVLPVLLGAAACTGSSAGPEDPGLAPRGTTMTTAKPTRQNLTNQVSLSGKVTLNPVFGLAAPVAGQVRYLTVRTPTTTPTKPTTVATIVVSGKVVAKIDVPAGSTFSGRLVDDRSTVAAGTPVVSAKRVGYGIVADIDGGQAYKISDALATVQAQIAGGPGPFGCTVLGTIAALPEGTVPDPPAPPVTDPSAAPGGPVIKRPDVPTTGGTSSEPTGLRLVCVAAADVKLINGVSATLQVVTATVSNVLVLPVEAVAGSQGKGKVDVLRPDGSRETRDVTLGLTDGRVVEITSGLTGDETVAVPGPNLPPADPRGDGNFPGGKG